MSQSQQTPSPYFFPSPVDLFSGSTNSQPPHQFHPYNVPQIGAFNPTFTPAVDSFIGTRVASATSPSTTKDLKVTTEPDNVVPVAFRCEVCDVVCNSKDAFQTHTQGKRHRKNLQRKVFSSPVSIQNATVEQADTTAATFSEELEKKKQALLKNGAAVGSLRFCTICNAACSDEAVFQMHVVGKKHVAQVAKQVIAARLLDVAGPPNPISMAIPSQQPPANDTEGEPEEDVAKQVVAAGPLDVAGPPNPISMAIPSQQLPANDIEGEPEEDVAKQVIAAGLLDVAGPPNPISMAIPSQQPPANDTEGEHAKKSHIAQSAWCDVCHELLKVHMSGKRHLRNLEKLQKINAPVASTLPAASAVSKVDVKNKRPQNALSGTTLPAASAVSKVIVKNKKPQNALSGTTLPAASAVSKVDVRNKEPQNALSGTTLPAASAVSKVDEKNKEPQNALFGTTPPAASTVSKVDVKNKEPQNALFGTTPPPASTVSKVDVKNKEPHNALSNWCTICNISCPSSEELNNHLLGKKHRKTLEKVNKFIGPLAPPATPPMIGPTIKLEGLIGNAAEMQKPENVSKRSRGSNEDVETKRQKIVGEGAAPDAVRVCTICNVVCNSPTVFISHLAGQKHLAMAKKGAEAGLPSPNA